MSVYVPMGVTITAVQPFTLTYTSINRTATGSYGLLA